MKSALINFIHCQWRRKSEKLTFSRRFITSQPPTTTTIKGGWKSDFNFISFTFYIHSEWKSRRMTNANGGEFLSPFVWPRSWKIAFFKFLFSSFCIFPQRESVGRVRRCIMLSFLISSSRDSDVDFSTRQSDGGRGISKANSFFSSFLKNIVPWEGKFPAIKHTHTILYESIKLLCLLFSYPTFRSFGWASSWASAPLKALRGVAYHA